MARKKKEVVAQSAEALDFFKYDPSTDGDQTFNIDKALNENWDKTKAELIRQEQEDTRLDGEIKKVRSEINEAVGNIDLSSVNRHTTTEVNAARDNIKSHITSEIAKVPQKTVWTDARGAKLDTLDQGIIKTQSNINGYIVSARDNIKTHVTTEKNAMVTKLDAIIKAQNETGLKKPTNTIKHTFMTSYKIGNATKNMVVIGHLNSINTGDVVRIKWDAFNINVNSSSTYEVYIAFNIKMAAMTTYGKPNVGTTGTSSISGFSNEYTLASESVTVATTTSWKSVTVPAGSVDVVLSSKGSTKFMAGPQVIVAQLTASTGSGTTYGNIQTGLTISPNVKFCYN